MYITQILKAVKQGVEQSKNLKEANKNRFQWEFVNREDSFSKLGLKGVQLKVHVWLQLEIPNFQFGP